MSGEELVKKAGVISAVRDYEKRKLERETDGYREVGDVMALTS